MKSDIITRKKMEELNSKLQSLQKIMDEKDDELKQAKEKLEHAATLESQNDKAVKDFEDMKAKYANFENKAIINVHVHDSIF